MNLLVIRFRDEKPHPPGQTGCWALIHFEPSPRGRYLLEGLSPETASNTFLLLVLYCIRANAQILRTQGSC